MSSDWIENALRDAEVPPSGERRERTVTLARAVAPDARPSWRARVARPRVVVPLAALMIGAMTAPGQAATGSAANFVAKIVPMHSQALRAVPAHGGGVYRVTGSAGPGGSSASGIGIVRGGVPANVAQAGHVRCGRNFATARAHRLPPPPLFRARGVTRLRRAPAVRALPARPLRGVPVAPGLPAKPLGAPNSLPAPHPPHAMLRAVPAPPRSR
jgi:hypothetical protein